MRLMMFISLLFTSACGRASLGSVSSAAMTDQIVRSRSDQRPMQPGHRHEAQRPGAKNELKQD